MPSSGFSFGASGRPQLPSETVTPPMVVPPNPQANIWSMLGQALAGAGASGKGLDIPALLTALRNDPQGDANKGYIPGVDNASSPFSNGFFKDGASNMSPEARVASQGRSATNQWAALGGVPGVDPAKLQNIMGQMQPHPNGLGVGEPSVDQYSDPFFASKLEHMLNPHPFLLPQQPQVKKPQAKPATKGFSFSL